MSSPASVEDVLSALYQAVNLLTDRLDRLDSRLGALESNPPPPPTAAPKASSARGPRAARSKSTKSKAPAPTTPSTTKAPATAAIRTLATQVVQEKITVTLSVPDVQTGHLVGRTETGLHQIHDISHAKLSVSPTIVAGLRVVTIRGSNREVGDAITAVGKRLARHRLRTPRLTKKKTTPTSPPPVVEEITKPSTSSSTPKAPTQVIPSSRSPLPTPTLPPVEPRSGPPSVVPSSSSSQVIDASKFPRVAAALAGRRPKGQ